MGKTSQVKLLSIVFSNVYHKEFCSSDLEHRIMLQKAVFIMHEMGLPCGDYRFVWDQFGTFSLDLSDDMKKEIGKDEDDIVLNEDAVNVMEYLQKLFNKESDDYSVREWAEAIASLLYLRKYVYPSYTDEQLIDSLEDKKKYLRNRQLNLEALNAAKKIAEM